MRFFLEVTMDDAALTKDPAGELGRILRYWGGNLRHYPLRPGDGQVDHRGDARVFGERRRHRSSVRRISRRWIGSSRAPHSYL